MSVTIISFVIAMVIISLVATALYTHYLRPHDGKDQSSLCQTIQDGDERLQRILREEQRAGRDELQQRFDHFGKHIGQQISQLLQQQSDRIDDFAKRMETLTTRTDHGMKTLSQGLSHDARAGREELANTLKRFGEQYEKRMSEVRTTLENQISALQQDNANQLEKMRNTVDEKLQSTLEKRLGDSFKLVSERLEAVQRGLGEMQQLATGVGDLKRVLSNVKTRGTFGEVQLENLLQDMLTIEQYEANIATVPGSNERVDFAIRMPGQSDRQGYVYLPIDAKFPTEDYQRLLSAQENADLDAANRAGKDLEIRVRNEARRIADKYIAPPYTTDFGLLFLPTEGLYAEIIRRPGLCETLQREHRIIITGPTTLSALLNSLRVGFRTVAIEQRSSEVWKLLSAVKTEFGKFREVLDKVKKKLDEAGRQIEFTGVRTRAIERKLRGVESLSAEIESSSLSDQTLPHTSPDTHPFLERAD